MRCASCNKRRWEEAAAFWGRIELYWGRVHDSDHDGGGNTSLPEDFGSFL
jgi:hypothetical protein